MVKYLLTKEESSNNQFWQSSAENSILKLGSKPFSNRFVEWHPQIVSYQRLLQAQKHTCVGCSASCHCCKLWGAMRLPVSTETAVVNLPLTSVSNITSEAFDISTWGAPVCATTFTTRNNLVSCDKLLQEPTKFTIKTSRTKEALC